MVLANDSNPNCISLEKNIYHYNSIINTIYTFGQKYTFKVEQVENIYYIYSSKQLSEEDRSKFFETLHYEQIRNALDKQFHKIKEQIIIKAFSRNDE